MKTPYKRKIKSTAHQVSVAINCFLWFFIDVYGQCRINNSNKCSNCYGLSAFGGPADLCVKLLLY